MNLLYFLVSLYVNPTVLVSKLFRSGWIAWSSASAAWPQSCDQELFLLKRQTHLWLLSHCKLWRQRNNLNVVAHLDVLAIKLAGTHQISIQQLEFEAQWFQYEVTELSIKRVVPELHGTADFCPGRLWELQILLTADRHDSETATSVTKTSISSTALDMAKLESKKIRWLLLLDPL